MLSRRENPAPSAQEAVPAGPTAETIQQRHLELLDHQYHELLIQFRPQPGNNVADRRFLSSVSTEYGMELYEPMGEQNMFVSAESVQSIDTSFSSSGPTSQYSIVPNALTTDVAITSSSMNIHNNNTTHTNATSPTVSLTATLHPPQSIVVNVTNAHPPRPVVEKLEIENEDDLPFSNKAAYMWWGAGCCCCCLCGLHHCYLGNARAAALWFAT
eukprot:GEZU01018939.1.p1 GENE.GEZU01018939.1~~GEZU01018939.1.p1  ORF type:complete len:214 (-),score=18.46 GEZU01018939.1:203-844(-)